MIEGANHDIARPGEGRRPFAAGQRLPATVSGVFAKADQEKGSVPARHGAGANRKMLLPSLRLGNDFR